MSNILCFPDKQKHQWFLMILLGNAAPFESSVSSEGTLSVIDWFCLDEQENGSLQLNYPLKGYSSNSAHIVGYAFNFLLNKQDHW